MTEIIYVDHEGGRHSVALPDGISLMEGAVTNDVPGIDGDCGGACACATCHIFVDAAWVGKMGPRNDDEAAMLELVDGAQANSRLACQILVQPALDGLIIHLPESQH